MRKGLLALLFLGVVFSPWALSYVGYISPHVDEAHYTLMNDTEEMLTCPTCHEYDPETNELQERRFVVDLSPTCWGPEDDPSCHDKTRNAGRTHPVDILPEEATPEIIVPEVLPLQAIDGEYWEDTMTCGTCHNPHGDFLSTEKLFAKQTAHSVMEVTPGEEIAYYKTYYLRITNNDPEEGFTPLCQACHPDY